jgi:AcrR family transcriptional regulator
VPRAGLTPEVVVAEAAKVADASGYDRLTLAAVAQRFGVAVPSLYKHVAGLDALHREVAIRGIRELGDALAVAVRGGEDERLLAIAHAYRAYARSHPGRYAATLRAPDPDDSEAGSASRALLETGVFGSVRIRAHPSRCNRCHARPARRAPRLRAARGGGRFRLATGRRPLLRPARRTPRRRSAQLETSPLSSFFSSPTLVGVVTGEKNGLGYQSRFNSRPSERNRTSTSIVASTSETSAISLTVCT